MPRAVPREVFHGVMAAAFAAMAVPCMTHPDLISRLFIAGGPLSARERLLMRCFGSQALLTAVAVGLGRWEPREYGIWSAAIVPFFAFDAMASAAGLLKPAGAVGDAIGNAAFISLSYLAARAAPRAA